MSTYISPRLYPNKQFKAVQKSIKKIKQTKKQGFSDNEIYSLDISAAKWLLTKMEKSSVIINKSDIEINQIIWFLENVSINKIENIDLNKNHSWWNKYNESCFLFTQNILNLSFDKEKSFEIAYDFANWFLPRFERYIEIEKAVLACSEEVETINIWLFKMENIHWMFEQIIKKDTSGARFKRAQEIFGNEFLGLWI